jgi:hypothetical protein
MASSFERVIVGYINRTKERATAMNLASSMVGMIER